MTKLIFLAVTSMILAGCSTTEVPPRQSARNSTGRDESQQKPLFLYLLAPGSSPGASAHRIASTRVYLAQDFSVSVGDPDDPFTNHWDGAWTNARIGTNGVAEKRPLGSIWNSGDAVLAGRIELRDGKFFAQLQGRNQTTLNYFQGEIDLEKPVEQHGGWYHLASISGVWFALSESPDCGGFLRDLNNGKLRSPAIVERDSPEAKQWMEPNSNESSGSRKKVQVRPESKGGTEHTNDAPKN